LSSSLIIIPTYNEAENIRQIILAALGRSDDYHVLIVDDGSPDGTAGLVKEFQIKHPERIHLLERSGKAGLGKAYLAGFSWALERKEYELIFEMDADFSHDPKDLNRLEQACLDGAGLSIGSRYVKNGSVKDWTWERKLLSFGASLYVRAILGLAIKDPTAGFKCYKREVLASIPLDQVNYVGYAFQIAMKLMVALKGFPITEVPIVFKDRELGTSKMSSAIFKEAILGVWRMRSLKKTIT
jgi:dolichol-phosphate mannosyltransferase